jgi:hypothetical protein
MEGLDLSTLNYWAVLLAALSMFMVGGIWYSGPLSKVWLRETGLKGKDLQSGVALSFGGTFLLSLLAAFILAMFIGTEADAYFGAFAGLMVGVWIATALGTNYLYERKSLTLFLINAGYNLIGFTVMGAVLGQWL